MGDIGSLLNMRVNLWANTVIYTSYTMSNAGWVISDYLLSSCYFSKGVLLNGDNTETHTLAIF